MAYNSNKGNQHSGDIQFEDDPNDTQIDFENDSIKLKTGTGGITRLEINNNHVSASGPVSGSAFFGDGSRLSNLPSGTPGGQSGQVQFNDDGNFDGESSFVFSAASGGRVGIGNSAPTHTLSVSGSTSVSGSLLVTGSVRGNILHMTHHNFNHGASGDVWIPWNSLIENATAGEEHMMVTPFSGRLVKIVLRPKNAQNGLVNLNLYVATDGTTQISDGSLVETLSGTMGANASTTATFFSSGSDHFGPGDGVGVQLDPQTNPGDTQITCVWEFEQE